MKSTARFVAKQRPPEHRQRVGSPPLLSSDIKGGHEGHSSRARQTEAEQQAAREHFERHFGAVDLGYPTGVDNEQIEADLTGEYAATHEDN